MKSKSLLGAFFASVISFTAHAQPLSHVQNLQAVTNQVKVGKMTVSLPVGEWRLLNSREGRISNFNGAMVGAETETKYLVRVNEVNQLIGSVLISGPKNSTPTVGWHDSFCDQKESDFLWVQQMDGRIKFPACLAIYHYPSLWNYEPQNESDKPISDWFKNNKIVLPRTELVVVYRKYFSGDYIRIAYSINPEVLGFAADTGTAWTNSNWHPKLIKEDADKVKYIGALKKWAQSIEPHHRASLLKGTPGVESLPAWPEK